MTKHPSLTLEGEDENAVRQLAALLVAHVEADVLVGRNRNPNRKEEDINDRQDLAQR